MPNLAALYAAQAKVRRLQADSSEAIRYQVFLR